MRDDYLNKDAHVFFARLRTEAQRNWAQAVIDELQQRYPMADHWTTGGEHQNYIDIRIGKKGRNLKKGRPVFYIRQDGPVSLFVHEQARGPGAAAVLSIETAPDRPRIKAWFEEFKPSNVGFARLEGTGLKPADYPDADDAKEEDEVEEGGDVLASQEPAEPVQALNRILYGPPGTGKTYRTVHEALSIIEGTSEPEGDFDEQKTRFDALRREGRIAFVTFHQSFSYEDFIEGIRAETVNGQLSYKVRDGIFKKMAISAMYRHSAAAPSGAEPDFDDIYDEFVEEVKASLPYSLHGAQGGKLEIKAINERGTFKLTHPGRTKLHGVSRARLKALYEAYPNQASLEKKGAATAITDVIGGANVTVYWAVLNRLLSFKEEIKDELAATGEQLSAVEEPDYEQMKRRVLAGDVLAPNGKPYVLIIDEINRGNMSRVFGELITLIEPGKRAGRRETAEVLLPYSNERFSVPANLYIIGTMNTADRSLAVVDTALRRRFDFVEMMPDPEALKTTDVGGVDLVRMLKTINLRIEHLYDREHTIGHSFFMGLTEESTLADLALIFKNNVLPLLEEYFYEDWEKIGKILGNSGIYTVQPATNLGFAHSGKSYRRNLDKLQNAATYLAIYQRAESQPEGLAASGNG